MMDQCDGIMNIITQSTEMNITENLVIGEEDHDRYPGKPYFLHIANYGDVGDKFNMGDGHNGARWPIGASDRYSTLEEAHLMYDKFIHYVKDKIVQAIKNPTEKKKPSYYQWK